MPAAGISSQYFMREVYPTAPSVQSEIAGFPV
jgi:hypothetical protein